MTRASRPADPATSGERSTRPFGAAPALRALVVGVALLVVGFATAAPRDRLHGSWRVDYFPGPYFDAVAFADLHREVLQRWPGPTALGAMWRRGTLEVADRQAILLGGAAFHDPQLLPLYIDAMDHRAEGVRQAAAYGYRDLLGDSRPDVRGGLDPASAAALKAEMQAVWSTLRRATLAELWTAALVANEGALPPGWQGVVLRRPATACLKALDRVVAVEDLPPLVVAASMVRDRTARLGLLRLIEGLTLQRMLVKPKGPRVVWGSSDYDRALEQLDQWVASTCAVDPVGELVAGFQRLGIRGLDPMGAEACVLWQELLLNGAPQWRGLASRMLYRCGGPAVFVDLLDPESEPNQKSWRQLLDWYKLGGAALPPTAVPERPSRRP